MAIVLLPKQHEFVYSTNEITTYYAGRGGGKTVAASFKIGNRLTHGRNVIGIAPTYKILNEGIVRETIDILKMYRWKLKYNASEERLIVFNKGREISRAYFRSDDNPEMIRSLSNIHDMVIDEAALCSRLSFELGLACLRGKDVRNPQCSLITTPRGRANWTADLYLDQENKAIHSTVDENTTIDTESFKRMLLRQYGEDFARQEIYAEILDSTEAGLFKARHLDTLFGGCAWEPDVITFGFDVAGNGNDFSAVTVKSGNRLLDIQKRKTPGDPELICFYTEMHNKWNPQIVNIDSTGLGQFLPTRLKSIFPNVTFNAVHFGSVIRIGYKNARTQIYFDLKQAIESGLHFAQGVGAEFVNEIEKSLYATEYFIDGKSDFALIPKVKIAEAIGFSPDVTDSMALSCLDNGKIRADVVRDGLQRLKKLSMKKNPLRR